MRFLESASSAYLLVNPDVALTPSFLKARYLLLKRLYHSIEINLSSVHQYLHLDEAYNALKEQPRSLDFPAYQQVIRDLFLNMSEHIRHGLYDKENHLRIVALAGESLALIDQAKSIDELISIYLAFLQNVASIKSISQIKKQKTDRLVLRIVMGFVIFTFVALFYTVFVIMPSVKYENAKLATLEGRFDEAYEAFISLGEYSDAKRQAELVQVHRLCQSGDYEAAIEAAKKLDLEVEALYNPVGGMVVDDSAGTYANLDGYAFINWHLSSYELKDNVLTLKLKANYSLITYQITYLDVDSTDYPHTYDITKSITLPILERFGYVFEGWTSSDGKVAKSYYLNKGVFGDLVLSPSFKPLDYAIQINLDHGNLPDDIPSTYNMDTDTIHIGAPKRDGYTFTGWTTNLNNELQESVDIPKGSFGTLQLFAHYTPNTYQISYQLNGGDGQMLSSYQTDDGSVLRTPTRKGYTFTGWTDSENSEPTLNYQLTYGDLDLSANWQINTYRFHLDSAGGSLDSDYLDVTYLEEYHLPSPNKLGYRFDGWYYAGIKIEDGQYQNDYDMNLVAKWTPRDDINYVVNHYWQNLDDDEFTLHEASVLFGITDTTIKVAVNSYEGFVTPPIQDLTIDPKGLLQVDYYYYRNSYDVYFFTNGGQPMASQSFKYGAFIEAPDAIRSGFTFGGWYLDMELTQGFSTITMPGHPVYLYAWYEEELKPTSLIYQMIDNNEENPQEYFQITSFNGDLGISVVLPSFIGDIPVLSIDDGAFIDASMIEIKLPMNLLYMGKDVFNQNNLIIYLQSQMANYGWSEWCSETTILYYE